MHPANNPSQNQALQAKQSFAFRLVIGGRDMEAGAVSVRLRHGGLQGAKPNGEVVAEILTDIRNRKS